MLTAGSIKFTPELPKRTLDAASKVGLGSYDHVVLQLPGNPLGLSRDDVVIEQSKDARTAFMIANMEDRRCVRSMLRARSAAI